MSSDPSAAAIPRARIAIVDDSRFDREIARSALAGLGELVVFEEAESALEFLRREPCDILVSDVTLPGISGVALLEAVRRERLDLDVVMLTGNASVETAVAALRAGALDYLVKPLREEHLRHIVEQAALRRRLLHENARLSAALRIAEACRALAPCLEPGEVYPVALDLLIGTLGLDRGLSIFKRASLPTGHGVAFRGIEESQAAQLRHLLVESKRLDLEAFATTAVDDDGPVHQVLRQVGIEPGGLLTVPLRGELDEYGVAFVPSEGRDFSVEELSHIESVRAHAEAALHNAERYHQAKERAFVDDVTELYNARYLLSAVENEVRRAERNQNALSVLFLDLDRFKLVNDRHGHLVGSETLRRLSQLLLESVRQIDILARYGGDEFTIVLVDTDHSVAMTVAERIRCSVEEALFEVGGAASLRLSVSVGVASFPEHGSTSDALLDAADKAMYRAKSHGRNRVCSAAELDDLEVAVVSDRRAERDSRKA